MGKEHEATVPLFNLWSLWWTADRVGHTFAHYWDAPIFYPNKGVFTYSEPQPLTGLLVAPLWGLGAPPALIYNLAFLAVLTLNGVFAYRLGRALEVPAFPSLLAGIVTVTLPFAAKMSGVLPLVALFGMLWTLEGFVRFGTEGTTRSAVWAAAGFLATFVTCQQYALVVAPFAGVAGLVALAHRRWQPRAVILLVSVGLLLGFIVVLIAFPAITVHAALGFRRPEWVVQALSARPSDFLTRPSTSLLKFPPPDAGDTAGLFPGAILLILGLAGAAIGLRDAKRRRWTAYLVGSGIAAGLLALGLNLNLAGWRPFSTLRVLLPGLDELRSPYRFAVIIQLCLPILGSIAIARARGWCPSGGKEFIVLLVALLTIGENLAIPAPLTPVPTQPRTAWTAWLRAHPEHAVIVHIPFPSGVHVSDYEIETWRMFAQIDHRKPMVNGYSGYFPQARTPFGSVLPTYTHFQLAMATQFPNGQLLCVLVKKLGASTLIVGQDWLRGHRPQMEIHLDFLRPAFADEQVQIYSLAVPEGRCQPGTW